MKKFFISMFTDDRGSISHKRIIGVMCAMFLCVSMVLTIYSRENVKPADSLVDAVLTLGCVCIAGTTIDKFSNKVSKTEEKTEE